MLIQNVLHHYLDDHDCGVFQRGRIKTLITPSAYVINTDPHNKKGEHWTAVYIDKKEEGHYFDPYGFPPYHDEILVS